MREESWGPGMLKRFFVQYAKYVHRFTNWLGLIVANAASTEVQAYLVPNLAGEVRDATHQISHRQMLARLLTAIGVDEGEIERTPSRDETARGCRFFEEQYGSSRTLVLL